MHTFNRIDLRRLILLLTLTVALFSFFNSFHASYQTQRDLLIHHTLESNRVYAAKLRLSTEQLLDTMRQQLTYSASQLAERMDQPERLAGETERLIRQTRHFNSAFVVRHDGKVLAASPESLGMLGQMLDSAGAREALEKRRPLISAPYVSAKNNLVVFVSQPILAADGTYQGYVGGSIYLQQENILHTLLGEHFYQDGSYLYVVDRNRHLIYHQNLQRVGETVAGNPVIERVIRGEAGSQALSNSQGIEMLAGFAPVTDAGWGIVAQRATELTLQELDGLMLNILRLSLPMLLLSLGGIWWLSQLISRPLWQLAKSAQQWDTDESPEQVRHIKAWYFEADQLKRAVLSGLALLHQRLGKLSQESLTDPLTGLSNRRGMQAQLGQWQRQSQPFAVIALDIDHFKQVNDNHGHEFGDRVLQHLAQQMSDCSRASDLLCRSGGEEFLMLLPGTSPEAARQVAERLRARMGSTCCTDCPSVTVSAGVAHWPNSAASVEEVFKRADAALYRAKHAGRNRVAVG
ncbi:GGDEF domain-containing protein [Azotobacter beijerinckii]|uniref:diguanylate cyclase n=1 Tax=Azotobacter beijerinckii TaxID=170623 RepID=A0A1I4B8D2_9GAMM|nr:sensor domain-containing diguanylate cyclase [Azotobacter beijerinckii]SFB05499.1 diguanylate cyclase (GGDEF) domain-containing protein [Azotobacter beijerinckii]SFK64813.1 diguanylate cyclase (GGDEF) domain-containing protein [Azotobacter beijerinckii]